MTYESISENKITYELKNFLAVNFCISKDLADWSRRNIHELRNSEISNQLLKQESLQQDKINFEKEKSKAREILRNGYITDEEYKTDLKLINQKYAHILKNTMKCDIDWISKLNEIIDLSESVEYIMSNGSQDQKRTVLFSMGSNLIWNEENLCFAWSEGVTTLINGLKGIREKYPWFEPKLNLTEQGLNEKMDPIQPIFSTMLC